MHSNIWSTAALALVASSLVSAQTFTACDPTKKDCPPNPAFADSVSIDLTQGEPKDYIQPLPGTQLTYDPSKGAIFSIKSETDAPTVASHKYIFFGRIDVVLRAAPGAGIVTSVVLQSDDLDEIDIEFVGGDTTRVQTNYFSKGDTTTYDRGRWHSVAQPMLQEHTYSIDWTPDYVKWYVDGTEVRTLTYAEAKGGSIFPQTPMQIKFGTWVAGKPGASQGTVEWAGGYADFSKGPFVANYKSIKITDNMGGAKGAKQYIYGDRSGTWRSIKVDTGSGAAANAQATPEEEDQPTPVTQVGKSASAPVVPVEESSAPETTLQSISAEPTPSTATIQSVDAEPTLSTATIQSINAEPTVRNGTFRASNATVARFSITASTTSIGRPEATGQAPGSGRASSSAQVFVAAAGNLGTSAGSAALTGAALLVAKLFLL